jgi:hypothetical protein
VDHNAMIARSATIADPATTVRAISFPMKLE